MIDIEPRTAILLKAILRTYVPSAEIWAFGSRVVGKAHASSDLDLVVRSPGALDRPVANMGELYSAIEESSVPFIVDLHDWALLPPAFQRQIEQSHIVFLAPVLGSSNSAATITLAIHEQ